MTNRTRVTGIAIMVALAVAAVGAPFFVPTEPWRQHADLAYAPPMLPRVTGTDGSVHLPFVYPLVVADRLERRYVADTTSPTPLRLFHDGRLISVEGTSWFPLGADPLGRDVLTRLVYGTRLSLLVALVATLLTLGVGVAAGTLAGYAGGFVDRIISVISDFVVILPVAYVVVTLRAAMPLVLSNAEVFTTIVGVLAASSWPLPSRVVRAIVAAERRKEYAEAAYAVGAGPLRILLRHLLPAAVSQLRAQAFLLFPAFILAEATLSFLGLGFAEPSSSWGVMLQDAGRVSAITEAPWLLAPAAAIVLAVLAMHLATAGDPETESAVRL